MNISTVQCNCTLSAPEIPFYMRRLQTARMLCSALTSLICGIAYTILNSFYRLIFSIDKSRFHYSATYHCRRADMILFNLFFLSGKMLHSSLNIFRNVRLLDSAYLSNAMEGEFRKKSKIPPHVEAEAGICMGGSLEYLHATVVEGESNEKASSRFCDGAPDRSALIQVKYKKKIDKMCALGGIALNEEEDKQFTKEVNAEKSRLQRKGHSLEQVKAMIKSFEEAKLRQYLMDKTKLLPPLGLRCTAVYLQKGTSEQLSDWATELPLGDYLLCSYNSIDKIGHASILRKEKRDVWALFDLNFGGYQYSDKHTITQDLQACLGNTQLLHAYKMEKA